MRYTQLTALVAVVMAGGIRAGARKLGISQAAVTRSLKEMETEVGVPLITRGTRGIKLTSHGERIYERASVMIEQMRRLDDEVDAMRMQGGRQVAFGVGPVIAATILPQVVEKFCVQEPAIRIVIGEGSLDTALAKLRNGSLEFLIAFTTGVSLGSEFTVTPILHTDQRIVGRKGHQFGKAKSLSPLLDARWVLTPDDEMGVGGRHYIFSSQGLPMPERAIICLNSTIGVRLVCETDMIAPFALPFTRLEEVRSKTEIIDVAEPLPTITYSMVHRSDIPLSRPAQVLYRLFHRNFPEWGWRKG